MIGHSTRRRAAALIVLVALVSVGACASATVDRDIPPGAMILSDANVGSIFATANNGEVQLANLALQRSQNEAVRTFAQRMVQDHTTANEELERIIQRAGIGLEPVETTEQLERTTAQAAKTLNELNGDAFDETYLQTQVQMHSWLLETIDDALIPSAGDGALEELLVQNRAIVAAHLEQAREIQRSLAQS